MSNWKFILDNLKEDKQERLEPNSKVLLIDGLNTFLRCFAIINHVNPQGTHIGGLTGFLKSMAFAIKMIKPTKVIVLFDGQGSSTNKRYLYPEYKANRNTTQIKNWNFDTKEEESEAIVNQLVQSINYLKLLPVHILSIDKIEADDVIGYLCNQFDKKVTIMSADRDFLQLVSDRIEVYSPTKKIFYTPTKVFDEYEVYPNNFIYYKTLLGDKGDNVPGIKGLGPVKLFKLLPELKGKETLELNKILESCEANKDKHLLYQNIIERKKQLEINYQLMNLSKPNIPEADIEVIDNVVTTSAKDFNKSIFIKMYNADQLGNTIPNVDVWLEENFRYLTTF